MFKTKGTEALIFIRNNLIQGHRKIRFVKNAFGLYLYFVLRTHFYCRLRLGTLAADVSSISDVNNFESGHDLRRCEINQRYFHISIVCALPKLSEVHGLKLAVRFTVL
jgi:hypothetical protein